MILANKSFCDIATVKDQYDIVLASTILAAFAISIAKYMYNDIQ